MKILVEIDLPDIEPKDIYKPNSGWFTKPGYINIPYGIIIHLEHGFMLKYIGQVHDEVRP